MDTVQEYVNVMAHLGEVPRPRIPFILNCIFRVLPCFHTSLSELDQVRFDVWSAQECKADFVSVCHLYAVNMRKKKTIVTILCVVIPSSRDSEERYASLTNLQEQIPGHLVGMPGRFPLGRSSSRRTV